MSSIMSTGQSAVTLCGWGVKAGVVHYTCGQTCRRQVKLYDPSLTRAIPERFRDEFLMLKRCTNLRLRYFTSVQSWRCGWIFNKSAINWLHCSRTGINCERVYGKRLALISFPGAAAAAGGCPDVWTSQRRPVSLVVMVQIQ